MSVVLTQVRIIDALSSVVITDNAPLGSTTKTVTTKITGQVLIDGDMPIPIRAEILGLSFSSPNAQTTPIVLTFDTELPGNVQTIPVTVFDARDGSVIHQEDLDPLTLNPIDNSAKATLIRQDMFVPFPTANSCFEASQSFPNVIVYWQLLSRIDNRKSSKPVSVNWSMRSFGGGGGIVTIPAGTLGTLDTRVEMVDLLRAFCSTRFNTSILPNRSFTDGFQINEAHRTILRFGVSCPDCFSRNGSAFTEDPDDFTPIETVIVPPPVPPELQPPPIIQDPIADPEPPPPPPPPPELISETFVIMFDNGAANRIYVLSDAEFLTFIGRIPQGASVISQNDSSEATQGLQFVLDDINAVLNPPPPPPPEPEPVPEPEPEPEPVPEPPPPEPEPEPMPEPPPPEPEPEPMPPPPMPEPEPVPVPEPVPEEPPRSNVARNVLIALGLVAGTVIVVRRTS